MPRKPRFVVPGLPVHIVQRGNNRQVIFFEEYDYRVYLSLLDEAASRYDCQIHAYVLMTNHTHILATPGETMSVSRVMQYVGRHYVPYVNEKYQRSGTLWEGRYKATIVETSACLMACHRYIELNPVRAGMVQLPEEYPWSSYHRNGLRQSDALITPYPDYRNLGVNDVARARSYRLLFEQGLSDENLSSIRDYTQSGTPLGSAKFKDQIEATLAMKTGQPRQGRPKKDSQ